MLGDDSEAACAASDVAIAFANRFAEAISRLALLSKGQAVIGLRRLTEAVALLDEAMVGVSAEDVFRRRLQLADLPRRISAGGLSTDSRLAFARLQWPAYGSLIANR